MDILCLKRKLDDKDEFINDLVRQAEMDIIRILGETLKEHRIYDKADKKG